MSGFKPDRSCSSTSSSELDFISTTAEVMDESQVVPEYIYLKSEPCEVEVPSFNEQDMNLKMDEGNKSTDEWARKRELANARMRKYRKRKRDVSQKLYSLAQNEPTTDEMRNIKKQQIEEKKVYRRRKLARERSRRYRERKRIVALETIDHLIHDSQIPGPLRANPPFAVNEDICLESEPLETDFPTFEQVDVNLPSCSVEQEVCNIPSEPLSRNVFDSHVKYECKEEVKEEIIIEENPFPSEDEDVAVNSRNIKMRQRRVISSQKDCSKSSLAPVKFKQKTKSAKVKIAGKLTLHSLPLDNFSNITNPPVNMCSFTGENTLSGTLSSVPAKENKRYNFRNHSRVHTGEECFLCSVCSAKFWHSSDLKMHTRIHTGKRHFSCTLCSAKFTESSSLKVHIRMHTGDKPFSCKACSANFKNSSSLKRHICIHTGEKPFSCTVCSAKFRFNSDLKKHILMHTGEKPFSCTVCSAKFRFGSSLKLHTRTHTGEKPFSCKLCSAKFTKSSILKVHTRIHTGEKPFSCKVCSAKFSVSTNLKRHIRIHNGERPFSCTVCPAKFKCRSDLKRHTRIHTDEKPFSCTVCSARFNDGSSLKTHTRIHTNERPYSCAICSAEFRRKFDVRQHTRTHTGERQLFCEHCPATFNRKNSLQHHMSIHMIETVLGL